MKVKTCAIKQLNDVIRDKNTCAVIICSSYSSREEYKKDFRYSLFLNFDDIIDENKDRCFSFEMAKQVAEFIASLDSNNVTDICFCCDSGRSRSTAMAAAYLRRLKDNEYVYWENPIYNLNLLVYRLMSKVFDVPVSRFGLVHRVRKNSRALKKVVRNSR